MYALMDITITNPGVYYALFIFVGAIVFLVAGLAIASWTEPNSDDLPYLIEAFAGSVRRDGRGGLRFQDDDSPLLVVMGIPLWRNDDPEDKIEWWLPSTALSRSWLNCTTHSGMQIRFHRWYIKDNEYYAVCSYNQLTFYILIVFPDHAKAFQRWFDYDPNSRRQIVMPWDLETQRGS